LVWEFCISLFAALGGVIVLRGLWLEGYREQESHPTIEAYRSVKAREATGRKWVFWGVAFEVVLAFGMTFKDGFDIRELEKVSEKNDPLNAPINSASAVLRLRVKGVKQVPFDTPGGGVFLPPAPEETVGYGNGGITFFEGTNLTRQVYHLASGVGDIEILGSAIVGGSNDCRGVLVRFHEDSLGDDYFESFRSNRFEVGQPVRTFNGIGNFVISLPQMQTNVAVVSGVVELKANASRWKFPLPSQTQQYGIMTSQLVTNTGKGLEARIMRVPIVDFVIPPRFTNRVFTGEP
jgi:hypothetical protein